MMKLAIILITLMFFVACSQNQEVETVTETVSPPSHETTQSSSPDSEPGTRVIISPKKPTKDSTISLALNSLDSNDVDVEWLINNEVIYGDDKMSFSHDRLKKGNIIQARVTSEDMIEYYSNKLTIHNSPPVIVNAKFIPEKPKKDDPITMKINSADPDNDHIQYLYKWYVNNEYVSSETSLEGDFKRGDTIAVHLLASDGEDNSKITYKFETTIYNSPPIVSESLEGESLENNVYKVKLKAQDPDGDTLSYSIKEDIKNLEINQDGQVMWKIGTENAGKHTFTVTVKDGDDGEVALPVNVKIEFQGIEQKEAEQSKAAE